MAITYSYPLLAAAVCAALVALAMLATQRGRRERRTAQRHEHKEDLQSWENEGGAVAVAATDRASP